MSMCIPVEIGGTSLGHALVDQGATRTVMRITALKKFRNRNRIKKVNNMYVLGSTGELIPIVGRMIADITSNNIHLGRTLIYLVENTTEKDIICEIVIGRASLANGLYPCIDMRERGMIYHPSSNQSIPCLPCVFEKDASGVNQVKVLSSSTSTDHNNYTSKSNNSENEDKIVKVNTLRTLVNKRNELNGEQKEQLYTHLLCNMNEWETSNDEERVAESCKAAIMCDYMRQLDQCVPGSAAEDHIITHLFATYVPTVVQKPMHKQQEKQEKQEKDIIDDVEDIEFPFTPPTSKDNSPQYLKNKSIEIKKLIDNNDNLDEKQKKLLYDILITHQDRFSLAGENMERTDSVQHDIDTNNNRPFRERLRQYSPAVQDIIDKEVVKMLKEGVIVPSRSAYASNLLLVRKPDASSEGGVKNRVCASFVKLNEQTQKDSYPLPNIHYIFEKIGKSMWFTTMDLLSGFWQVMIKPEHRHKTAFVTMRGLYEFVVMPFGLCNAPATFQRLMDAIILPEYRSFIETYIDDLMTHSSTFSDHLKHLDILLKTLRQHKLVVKLSKCKFAQKEVKFLGHVISHNAIKTNPA
jgi:hypothetical protein